MSQAAMKSLHGPVTRLHLGRLPQGWMVRSRWYSSPSSKQSPKKSRRGISLLELVLLGGTGYVLYPYAFPAKSAEATTTTHGTSVPRVREAAPSQEDQIPVSSPVNVLDLIEANRKLREQVHTFSFEGADGRNGRIDVVRVPSNNPVEDDWSVGVGGRPGVQRHGMVLAGVYDGHAGWATSTVLRESLIPYVSTALTSLAPSSSPEAIDTAIKTAFKNLDDRIMEHAKKTVKTHNPGSPEALSALAPAVAGSCALLAIYEPITSMLRTAVTGDSRAVLGSWAADASTFTAEALSVDQNGFNEDEVARLCEAHPGEKEAMLDPRTGRLFGMAITRAFGDHRWKYPRDFLKHLRNRYFDTGPRPGYKTPPYMTAEPEITTRKVSTNDFVILASDGLWDHMSNEDAVECVSLWLAARRAGKAEVAPKQRQGPAEVTVAREGFGSWRATPEHFAIEDLDNAAVCLAKNAFGGNRRELFRGVMTEVAPRSRYVRDDVTVQVIFFEDPYQQAMKRP